MPALLDSSRLVIDETLPTEPSFVDILRPGDPFPRVPPKDYPRTTLAPADGLVTHQPKPRSASTPSTMSTTSSSSTSSSNSNPPQTPSKSRHRHRSTKSHAHPPPIDEDALLDLLRQFKEAKRREAAATLSSGVTAFLPAESHQHHRDVPLHSPTPAPLDRPIDITEKLESLKRRERAYSSVSARTNPISGSGTGTESIVIVLNHLRNETARANSAEREARDLIEKLKVVMKEKAEVEAQLGVVKEELGLYKAQLSLAQKGTWPARTLWPARLPTFTTSSSFRLVFIQTSVLLCSQLCLLKISISR